MYKKINMIIFINFVKSQLFYIIFFSTILALYRIIPHPPNFTPIIASAIMAPFLMKNKMASIILVILAMLLSDLIIGFHPYQLVIYSLLILISLLSPKILKYKNLFFYGVFSSLLFFLVTNFAVWLAWDYYSKDMNGLILCYTLALPFFTNTLISTIFFSFIIKILSTKLDKLNYKTYYFFAKHEN